MPAAAASRSKAGKRPQRQAQYSRFWPLTLGAIGVVYGDIGTSPIYAFREAAVAATGEAQVMPQTVLGILSLIVWSLLLLVTVKYVFALLRADFNGEGGTFALMALAQSVAQHNRYPLLLLGIAGASFLYGDAVIAPALSVISAIEGLRVITPAFDKLVVPLAIAILVGLFAFQSRGTGKVGALFGPILLVWFMILALVGIMQIAAYPRVLAALNPVHGVSFLINNGLVGFIVLGLVFLAVTGAEALYADLGHFTRVPIQTAWLGVALPALVLNYMGQGALVLGTPVAIANPFFLMFPEWLRWPVVLLTTAATVIASQAVITGAYSLTRQAVQLGLLPRFSIRHTSEEMAGQIYMPRVNWLLLGAVLVLVAVFKSSSALAAAYGVAVTASMITTSLMALVVFRRRWLWPAWRVAALLVPLLAIELVFFSANAIKLVEGAWMPLACAALLILVMLTWRRGAAILAAHDASFADLRTVVNALERKPPLRVSGTAVFLTATPDAAPSSLLHNLKHNHMLHERNFLLTIRTADAPRVPNNERIKIEPLSETFSAVTLTYGFMETPDVMKGLQLCRHRGLNIDPPATSFFLSRRILKPGSRPQMSRLREKLFIWLAGSAENATTYFQIPSDRVVEIGTQIVV
ncbi:MAG: potassium transporter Kup [Hyphomicrobiaceae bacterium]|nr:potassium transporter Kup [Hyphomicrobiaceae bacterium]